MPAKPGPYLVEIRWTANPLRGDKFEAAWAPVAEAALDYGATGWAFYRAADGKLDFIQHAVFPDKASGLYQVPLLPTYHYIVGSGESSAVSAGA